MVQIKEIINCKTFKDAEVLLNNLKGKVGDQIKLFICSSGFYDTPSKIEIYGKSCLCKLFDQKEVLKAFLQFVVKTEFLLKEDLVKIQHIHLPIYLHFAIKYKKLEAVKLLSDNDRNR
jgi:hypothetical protein